MWKFSLRVEFQVQLKAIEEFLSSVPEKLFSKLRDQHLEELTQSMTQIQHRFKLVQQQSEQKRVCEQMQNNGKGRGNDHNPPKFLSCSHSAEEAIKLS